ncbi:MAG: hemerythrin family protein [Elusimicrobia bacterium]|nr:hemerythrin family protein [Elusimicrobiota bacterium]
MAYNWCSSLETGNEEVDNQHKTLFAAVNELFLAREQGITEVDFRKSVDFLTTYALEHFATEERLMDEHNFPKAEHHKDCHEKLKQSVTALIEELNQNGYSPAIVDKAIQFVNNWLETHITTEDFELVSHIKLKQLEESMEKNK